MEQTLRAPETARSSLREYYEGLCLGMLVTPLLDVDGLIIRFIPT